MAVHPIEERYGTAEMRAVWSEENRFSCIVAAEVALAKAQARYGTIPAADADAIAANARTASPARAKEIEAEIGHDMMAIVKAIADVCGEAGRWVHYGATSNDILDTATALQLKQALNLLTASCAVSFPSSSGGQTRRRRSSVWGGRTGSTACRQPTGCGLRSGRARPGGISSASSSCALGWWSGR